MPMRDEISLVVPIDGELDPDQRKRIAEKIHYLIPGLIRYEFNAAGLSIDCHALADGGTTDLDEIVQFIADILRTSKRSQTKILFENNVPTSYAEDPYPQLRSEKQVVETLPGIFVLGGGFQKRFTQLDEIITGHADSQGAAERLVPTTVSTSALIDNGYLGDFPHHAIFAAPLKHDLHALERVAAREDASRAAFDVISDSVGVHDQVLAPTVCYHCFESLRGQTIGPADDRHLTAFGHCHRFESKNIRGLMRLQHFSMRELVSLGDADYVAGNLETTLQFISERLSDWGLKFRVVTATDPFFLGSSERKAMYQTTFALKRELLMYIPHDDSWLAVCSFNNHQGVIVNKYAIDIAGTEKPMSGCIGFGYERFLYAIYAQLGFEKAAWPHELQLDR